MPEAEGRVLFHHILSRSPWRRRQPSRYGDVPIPTRPGMVTLILEGLPRSGPFRLDEGRRALRVARAAMKRALDEPIDGDLVVVRSQ
jgi:NTE family protein